MSLTYLATIFNFLAVIGILTVEEAANLTNTVPVLILTLIGLWARYRIGDLKWFGARK